MPALTSDDVAGAAVSAEDMFQASSITPISGPSVRRLADLAPTTLAIMHGSSFTGDCATQLHALADDFDSRLNGAR